MSSTSRLKRSRLARAIALVCIAAPLGGFAADALAQNVDLGNLGERGFRVEGIDAGDRSGISVSGAGDVNGDGLADLIIGANRADPGGRSDAGETYVVFGRADSTPVDLAALGAGGFRIAGVDGGDNMVGTGTQSIPGDEYDVVLVGHAAHRGTATAVPCLAALPLTGAGLALQRIEQAHLVGLDDARQLAGHDLVRQFQEPMPPAEGKRPANPS
jgi:hypothetical protein